MSDEKPGLDPDEPQTPLWFTLLGLGLFLLGGIFMLVVGAAEESPDDALPTAQDAPSEAPTPADPGE